jgi:beta-fructofuranosidase
MGKDMNIPALSTLTAQSPRAEFAPPSDATMGFTVKFMVEIKEFDHEIEILSMPTVLSVRLRQHDPYDRKRQNYPAFKMPDGTVPVLEATVMLHDTGDVKEKHMIIGFPLAMLQKSKTGHVIALNFTGVHWEMVVGEELLDRDFPVGYPHWSLENKWELHPDFLQTAALYIPAIAPKKKPAQTNDISSIQYWTPPGHNTWVGDVATCFHQGRYHVFYLYDRRHHQSKFGKGGHYFEHLSTRDFKTWTEHEAAVSLEEQWESVGTGTPFIMSGKLCLAYGLHTERFYSDEKTTLPAQMEYIQANGHSGRFDRSAPGVPIGSTYAMCEDGVAKFKKMWVFFHPCRNPSIFHDTKGKLFMFANYGSRGTWESEAVESGWRCVNPDFPPGGDCTFFFHWGGFDYVIGGFENLWMKPASAPDSAYDDLVQKGLDFYDGSNVPAITEIDGGRFLMAAWIPVLGWGGNLVIRELRQYPDGRIGTKWMEEIMPQTEAARMLAETVGETKSFLTGDDSFLLTFDVRQIETKKGRFGISFLPEDGALNACELQLNLEDRRAQYAPGIMEGFAKQEKSLREGGKPQAAGDYSIENLLGIEENFAVRLVVKSGDKIGGSLIDTEIAGQRTMLSYRPDLTVRSLVFRTQGVELTNVRISPLIADHA